MFNGAATFLLYAALGLGSITLVAPLVALFPLIAVVMSLSCCAMNACMRWVCWESSSAWPA